MAKSKANWDAGIAMLEQAHHDITKRMTSSDLSDLSEYPGMAELCRNEVPLGQASSRAHLVCTEMLQLVNSVDKWVGDAYKTSGVDILGYAHEEVFVRMEELEEKHKYDSQVVVYVQLLELRKIVKMLNSNLMWRHGIGRGNKASNGALMDAWKK